ncbi:LPXTG cell wall anchor domain-containing protein [Facklamia miroungae]|uniref:LPXTG-motif cell wall anchor domain-containing protein n=1 Tax=Facklamia miroungae TaxID=120956 RepID=A0A1G7T6S0_9LACT|nr:LPXTG cell wall anchor domain-containing protein [Facklamia miroungae]NKZ29686.1 LPXTG cell wall anchor domain-containing protein [Facklamia miroungae]SDG30938.1 LPXTG-motif cell wall anchor domain-containing protein [Facklamia miroungae]
MFKRKNIVSFFLVGNLLAVPFFETQEVLARVETEVETQYVSPEFNIFLQIDENAPQTQNEISFDIIDKATQSVVYSYRSDDTDHQPIELFAGEYIFRLYDGGSFQREGQIIKPYQVQIGKENQGEAEELAANPGEIVELADQSTVYDFIFTIDESQFDFSPVFDIYLVGDQVQNPQAPEIESMPEDGSQETETSEATSIEETSQASPEEITEESQADFQVEVYDQDQMPVEGVKIQLTNTEEPQANQELISDENGIAQASEIPAGNYQYQVVETPETHSAEGTVLDAQIIAGEENRQVIGITKLAQVGQMSIQITDKQGQPIDQAEVQAGDQTYTSNADGYILIDSLPVGNYDVTLLSVPGEEKIDGNVQNVEVIDQQTVELTFEVDNTTTTLETTTTEEPTTTTEEPTTTTEEPTTTTEEPTTTTEEPTTTTEEPKAVLNIKVQDQNAEPVEDASLLLVNKETGQEQEIVTNSEGMATANNLALGSYQYQVSQAPEGYIAEGTLLDVAVDQEEPELQVVTIQKEATVGQVSIAVSDSQGQGLGQVQLQVGDISVETDEAGIALIEEMPIGEYLVKIVAVPEGYRLDQISPEKIEVKANQKTDLTYQLEEIKTTEQPTTTAEPTTTTEITTTQEPTTKEPTTTTVAETTKEQTTTSQITTTVTEESKVPERVFKDLEHGGEVLLTQSDAKKVAKVLIQNVAIDAANLPAALKGKDYVAYQVKAFDKDGNEITLENPTLIKLPTRPINSQVEAVKIKGLQVEPLKIRVNQQTASIDSQGLGMIALVYGDAKSDQTTTSTSQTQEDGKTVVVKKSTDRKEADKGNLPTAGETTSKVIYLIAGVLVVGGTLLITLRKRNQDQDK